VCGGGGIVAQRSTSCLPFAAKFNEKVGDLREARGGVVAGIPCCDHHSV
jgi:hypothetical protein